MTNYRLDSWSSNCDKGSDSIVFTTTFRIILRIEDVSWGIEWPEHESDESPPCSTKFCKVWNLITTSLLGLYGTFITVEFSYLKMESMSWFLRIFFMSWVSISVSEGYYNIELLVRSKLQLKHYRFFKSSNKIAVLGSATVWCYPRSFVGPFPRSFFLWAECWSKHWCSYDWHGFQQPNWSPSRNWWIFNK